MDEIIEIQLSNGGVAKISACDYELVSQYRWRKFKPSYCDITYARTEIRQDGKQRTLLMHRLILGLDFGNPLEGDHHNGDGLDNTRGNLRAATRWQNARNRRRVSNKHGFKGVTESSPGRYMAAIGDKSTGYLGCFATPHEAGAAYDQAAKEKYGEFAAPNSELHGGRGSC